MQVNTEDARTVRSKQALKDAALNFISHGQDFSIANLLEATEVSRGTFYRHYANKNALIRDVNQDLIQEILDQIDEQFPVARVINLVQERAAFYHQSLNMAINPSFYPELLRQLRQAAGYRLKQVTDPNVRRDLLYQGEVIMAGFWACLARWLTNNMELSQAKLLREFTEIFRISIGANSQTALIWFNFEPLP
ncbi:TetR/AcrR family transcriptional regulator [Convivina intestini]|uniref:TetR family transcriptional regulator n=1 Tax=Convivina intestini TaxID=1505726 RepID=A0A2U1DEJ1_9LACO|nr:TetR/AcrR family transcriptional regulator [Convivina intestini]PVY86105.1 TetR family transcriptional regulator [Convivina intestini]CAH1851466.1 hypothetical protein R077811_00393 [Convivina intestini]SDB80825.1 transcriptional regulator, TetR family [Leuconostocaceae bacterium R-53105]